MRILSKRLISFLLVAAMGISGFTVPGAVYASEEGDAAEYVTAEENDFGSYVYQLMAEGSEEVPENAVITWTLEMYNGSEWEPAADVSYILYDDEGPVFDDTQLATEEDGSVYLYKTGNGYPYIGFEDVKVYVNVTDPKEGDYRVVEDLDMTNPFWGDLVGYSVSPDDDAYGMKVENASAFVNYKDVNSEDGTDEYAPDEEIAVYSSEDPDTEHVLYMSDVTPAYTSIGYGSFMKDVNIESGPITLYVSGTLTEFEKGVGAHAESTLIYDVASLIEEGYDYFYTYYGVNSTKPSGNVKFYMYTTCEEDYTTDNWTEVEIDNSAKSGGSNAGFVEIPLTEGMTYIKLYADPNGSNNADHSVYGDAKFIKSDGYFNDFISRVEDYDEEIKALYEIYGTDIEQDSEYEKLILKRELVDRVGYIPFQDLLRSDDGDEIEAMLEDLFDDMEFLRMYMTGGSVGGVIRGSLTMNFANKDVQWLYMYNNSWILNWDNSVLAMYELYKAHPEDFHDESNNQIYQKMLAATALTVTGQLEYWYAPTGSGTVDESITKPDPVRRYEIYKQLYLEDRLVDYFDELQVGELKYVMGSYIHDEEIEWTNDLMAANNYPSNSSRFVPYSYSWDSYTRDDLYDPDMWDYYDEKYNLSEYGITNHGYGDTTNIKYPMLWMTMERGGVCWQQACFAQCMLSSYGRPCFTVDTAVAKEKHFGFEHAIYMIYNRETDADGNSYGRWTIENAQGSNWDTVNLVASTWKIDGFAQFINDWSMDSNTTFWGGASYIILGQAAMNDYENFVKADELLMLSHVFDDEETLEAVYRTMLDYEGFNFDAWEGLAKLYANSDNKSGLDIVNLAYELMDKDALYYYPIPMRDILKILKKAVSGTSYEANISAKEESTLASAANTTSDEFYSDYAVRVVANDLLGNVDTDIGSFSFDGEDAGKIMLYEDKFVNPEYWEYSLDGGETWSEIVHSSDVDDAVDEEDTGEGQIVVENPNVVQLSDEEIAQITDENDIIIRFIAIPDAWYTIDIETSPTPTIGSTSNMYGLYANPWSSRVAYAEDTMEWRYVGDSEWINYSEERPDRLRGRDFDIRYGAHANMVAGDYVTLSYDNPDSGFVEEAGYTYYPVFTDDGSYGGYQQGIWWYTYWESSAYSAVYALDESIYAYYKPKSTYAYPHTLQLYLRGGGTVLSKIEFQPALDGPSPTRVKIYTSEDEDNWTEVTYLEGTDGLEDYNDGLIWDADDTSVKTIYFEPVHANYVRIDSYDTVMTLANMRLFSDAMSMSTVDKTEIRALCDEMAALDLHENNFTDASWRTYRRAYSNAVAVANDLDADQDDVDKAMSALQSAYDSLEKAFAISGTISWSDNSNQDGKRPAYVDVNAVNADGEIAGTARVYKSSGNSSSYRISDLAGSEGDYTITAEAPEGYSVSISGNDVTFSHTPETVAITVKVTWDDDGNSAGARPSTIRCHLLADGVKSDSANLNSSVWSNYTGFGNRPKYKNGHEINYTVVLDSATNPATNYSTTYAGFTPNFEIINTYTPDQTSASVIIAWNDANDQDGKRPDSVTVDLYKDGEDTGEKLNLSAENNWRGSFTGLEKGGDYSYVEESVDGYTSSTSYTTSYGYIITNSHTPETVDVEGTIYWNDNGNASGNRPDQVNVRVYGNGEEVAGSVATYSAGWFSRLLSSITGGSAETSWGYRISGLPKYEDGVEINYAVTQDSIMDYSTTYDGLDIINNYESGEMSISVLMNWIDNGDQDGVRPESVKVELLVDGEATGNTVTLSESNNWTGSFIELEEADEDGDHRYSVRVEDISGYTTTVAGSMLKGFVITGAHEIEMVEISGSKIWLGGTDDDKPESITVSLYADGELCDADPLTVTAADGWEWDFGSVDKNSEGREIDYAVVEAPVDDYVTDYEGYDITNTYTKGENSITISKVWEDEDDQDGIRPESVTVYVYQEDEEDPDVLTLYDTVTLSGDNDWIGTVDVREYDNDGDRIYYEVKEAEVEGYTAFVSGSMDDGFVITNTHEPETIDIVGYKVWDDNDDEAGERPDTITVNLYADGVEERTHNITVEKSTLLQRIVNFLSGSSDSGWYWEFDDLPKYNAGKEIEYTISEEPVEGYESVVEGYDIVNTYIGTETEEETVDITVSKIWDDASDQDGLRPDSINVQLLADDVEYGDPVTFTGEGDTWSSTWKGLPKYISDEEITYTVEEVGEIAGYSTEYSDDGLTITNTHTPGTVDITGTKTWDDENDQDGVRPEKITVYLYADGAVIDSAEVTAEDDWSYSFTDLPEFSNGVQIAYQIHEAALDDYDTVYDGYDVTNKYEPGKTSVTVSKVWKDADNQDGVRPESVAVELLANDEATGRTLVLNEADNWQVSFTGLDEYTNGTKNTYTVREVPMDGYDAVISGDAETGYIITNTHIPEETDVSVAKIWDDADDQDGIRPDSVEVALVANGTPTGRTLALNETNNWQVSFTGLDKYTNGAENIYTVQEVPVDGYDTAITGDAETGYLITNSHAPETVNIYGEKIWDDNDDQDGVRPDFVTIRVWNGTYNVETTIVTAEDNWVWSFTDLPKYENGEAIGYVITEDGIENYTTKISRDETGAYIITNTHEPEKTELTVTKSWDDADNQDGIRPDSVTVTLMENGEPVTNGMFNRAVTITLDEGNSWTDSFTDLDVYTDGVKNSYTVDEISVDGYDTTISGNADDGYIVTNSHTPETVTLDGSLIWDDADDQDGVRPDYITIHLYGDGNLISTEQVTAADNWSWTFADLPKYSRGTEIVYTIAEDAVEGYETAADGMNVTNTHITETVNIPVNKVWEDEDSYDHRPNRIIVELVADGVDTDTTITLSNLGGWTGTFTGLDKYRDGGVEIDYSVKEISDEALQYYTPKIVYNEDGSITIVNQREYYDIDEEIVVDEDDRDSWVRNESVNEYNAIEIEMSTYLPVIEPEELASGEYTINFHDVLDSELVLDQNDSDFTVYIGETEIPHDYYVITFAESSSPIRTLAIGEPVTDGCAFHVDVDLTALYQDGIITDGDLQGDTELMIFFYADLEGTDLNGSYTSTVWYEVWDGEDLEYVSEEEVISVYTYEICIETYDADSGKALAGAIFGVYYDAECTDPVIRNGQAYTVTSGENGEAIFYGLAEGVYYVAEIKAPIGYDLSDEVLEVVIGEYLNDVGHMYIDRYSNTYGLTEVAGSKTWDDADNQDGMRPEYITVNLMADGAVVDSEKVSASDGWAWSFTKLEKYNAEGDEIIYTISEDVVEGYTTVIDGYDIVNSRTPGEVGLNVQKLWYDADDQDGIRPDSVTVVLTKNGELTGDTLILTEADQWAGAFTGLPEYTGGVKNVYGIVEIDVDGYICETEMVDDTSTVIICNTHTPETVDDEGSKTGDNEDDQGGSRDDQSSGDDQGGSKDDQSSGDDQGGSRDDQSSGDDQGGSKDDQGSGDDQGGSKDDQHSGGDLTGGNEQHSDSDLDQSGNEQTGDGLIDEDVTGDELTGGDATDDELAGDEMTGDEDTGNEQSGEEQSEDEQDIVTADGSDGGSTGSISSSGGSSSTVSSDGSGASSTGSAKTADDNTPYLYLLLILAAGAAIVTVSMRRRTVRK